MPLNCISIQLLGWIKTNGNFHARRLEALLNEFSIVMCHWHDFLLRVGLRYCEQLSVSIFWTEQPICLVFQKNFSLNDYRGQISTV